MSQKDFIQKINEYKLDPKNTDSSSEDKMKQYNDDAMKIKIEVGWNEQDIDGKIGKCFDESGKK